jgi:hypothetical protein
MTEFTITKQVSKQGTNNLIIIPKSLKDEFQPRDLVEVKIKLLKRRVE